MSDDYSRVLGPLELLRRSGNRALWAKVRRVAINASCCTEVGPLIEVMETDPPCVLVSRPVVSASAVTDFIKGKPRVQFNDDGEVEGLWRGFGRDQSGPGIVWLSALEQMAGTNLRQQLWCEHHRFYVSSSRAPKAVERGAIWVPLNDVLTRRGIYVVSVPDKSGHLG
jgi:hypothetical protein